MRAVSIFGEVSRVGKPNRQTALLLAAGILAVVFSLGFFAGRNTVTYEVAAQTERTASQAAQAAPSSEEEAKTNAEAADEEADGAAVSYPIDLNLSLIHI